jgi:Protein of unknown function (DUF3048) N-terminal domain/Protein of unknown function (DUF3048) C-terminal domain
MDTDFRPRKRPGGSLRKALDERKPAETPTPPAKSDFKTPDEVAAQDDLIEEIDIAEEAPPVAPKSNGKGGRGKILEKLHISWPFGRKEWLILAALLILAAGTASYFLTRDTSKVVSSPVKAKKIVAKPKTVASTLTGVQVDPAVNQRPVTAVMIENSKDSRPQSGLSEAGVVFEAIAEGGITRFLALFQDTSPGDVGPVRSARPYYVQWAMGFDAGYAHVGGSPEAIQKIRDLGVKDLDQFYNSGAYRREAGRPAPHNVYTSVDALLQLQQSKGYNASTYKGFERKPVIVKKKKPIKKATQPTDNSAKTVDFTISGALYNVHYDYDAASNSYKRSMAGGPHTDNNGGKQISPTVVIGLVVPYSIHSDGKHSVYGVIGSGEAYIFQAGVVTKGTWTKNGEKDQILFTDSTGQPIQLEAGQTWLTALADAGRVKYTP